MTNGSITNRDLYDAINGLRIEIGERIEKVEEKVDENTNWRNKIVGQFTIMMVFIGTAINAFWDYLFNK